MSATSLVAASPPPTAELTREAARAEIEELIYEIGSITMGNMRGSYFHQMWIRYVWTQVEQTLGEELGISFDTVAFQQALDRLYEWDLAG
jgi:hypothetical protein